MNEFNVLLAAATNGTPSGSLFDALFARYIAPQESWRELESPLPITILAAGEDLIDYRIYGADGGVGEPTESGEPVGYKLPMVVRSGNLFDKSFEQGYYGAGDGVKGNSPRYVRSNDKIPVLSDETYTVSYICPKEGVPQSGVGIDSYIYFWAADSSYIGYQQIMEKGNQTFTTPSNAAYVGFTIGAGSGRGALSPSDVSNFMLNSGATALPYQPYSRTDIPIYIGSDPLAEDEYVDFGDQKVYRMVNGTLTPTDPPVPIPALPTIRGETIIDYNPSEIPAVEPEKMYIKYKPQ